MALELLPRFWRDDGADGAVAAPGAGDGCRPRAGRAAGGALRPSSRCFVRPNRVLRRRRAGRSSIGRSPSPAALQFLATLVAFIGVLSALLSLELEKQRELGILRAIGLTVRQLWA